MKHPVTRITLKRTCSYGEVEITITRRTQKSTYAAYTGDIERIEQVSQYCHVLLSSYPEVILLVRHNARELMRFWHEIRRKHTTQEASHA